MIRKSFLTTAFVAFAFTLGAQADHHGSDAGFKAIFNGKDLSGWKGNPKFWSVKDGAITGRTTADNPTVPNTFIVWEDGKVDNFELRLKYKIVGDNEKGQANSGIQYRSTLLDAEKFIVSGYQADFEAGTTYSGILYEERERGILALRGEQVVLEPQVPGKKGAKKIVTGSVGKSEEIQAAIKANQWNDYTIIARGNHLVHIINGRKTVEITDNDPKERAMSGILALQLHQGPPMTVQFKDIKLKRLPLTHAKKLVMIAGKPSHGPLLHEFNAGVQLLDNCLQQGQDKVLSAVYLNGWPKDPTAFDNADGVFFYMDGRQKHEIAQTRERIAQIDALAAKGVGIGCAHYGVEVEPGVLGDQFKRWIGGHYEHEYSCNPMWSPDYQNLPVHPITRGVKPFKVLDEWYFNMRFRDQLTGVKPILMAVPSDKVRNGPYVYPKGPYPHIQANKGLPETMMWAVDRPDGGRGFGFTGGHYHVNWANDDYRKTVLNALVWMTGSEAPKGGIESTVSNELLMSNLDPKPDPRKRQKAKPKAKKKAAAKLVKGSKKK